MRSQGFLNLPKQWAGHDPKCPATSSAVCIFRTGLRDQLSSDPVYGAGLLVWVSMRDVASMTQQKHSE